MGIFLFVCLLNVGRSRFIDVTFDICGTRIHVWCVLYALVWCVGGLVGLHLDMALLWIQSTYAHRKQRPLGEIYFSGFFFLVLHFNVTHSNFPCCKLLEQFLVVIAWNYKFLFWVVVSLVVALVGSLGIEYIELWNKIAFVVVVVVSFFFLFFFPIILFMLT